jgi:hypothetical protein
VGREAGESEFLKDEGGNKGIENIFGKIDMDDMTFIETPRFGGVERGENLVESLHRTKRESK